MSKYAQAKRRRSVGYGTTDTGPSRDRPNVLAPLPEGVEEPSFWIKDEGEVKVEAKVWLANQRTYIKWQHIAILLASLSVGLFNAAGETNYIARTLGLVYTIVAVFIALWGWTMYIWRTNLIQKRSGKDFDNVIGPIVVCVGLMVALLLNFGFKYQAIRKDWNESHPNPGSMPSSVGTNTQGLNGSIAA